MKLLKSVKVTRHKLQSSPRSRDVDSFMFICSPWNYSPNTLPLPPIPPLSPSPPLPPHPDVWLMLMSSDRLWQITTLRWRRAEGRLALHRCWQLALSPSSSVKPNKQRPECLQVNESQTPPVGSEEERTMLVGPKTWTFIQLVNQ